MYPPACSDKKFSKVGTPKVYYTAYVCTCFVTINFSIAYFLNTPFLRHITNSTEWRKDPSTQRRNLTLVRKSGVYGASTLVVSAILLLSYDDSLLIYGLTKWQDQT